MEDALFAAGYDVTLGPLPENLWDGTNPPLSGFDVVIHRNGPTWPEPLPVSAQTALVEFVREYGGGFIGGQYNGYELVSDQQVGMSDLVLQLWSFNRNLLRV